jgi:hypothetical protein
MVTNSLDRADHTSLLSWARTGDSEGISQIFSKFRYPWKGLVASLYLLSLCRNYIGGGSLLWYISEKDMGFSFGQNFDGLGMFVRICFDVVLC